MITRITFTDKENTEDSSNCAANAEDRFSLRHIEVEINGETQEKICRCLFPAGE
jgi:hypothetical protein